MHPNLAFVFKEEENKTQDSGNRFSSFLDMGPQQYPEFSASQFRAKSTISEESKLI